MTPLECALGLCVCVDAQNQSALHEPIVPLRAPNGNVCSVRADARGHGVPGVETVKKRANISDKLQTTRLLNSNDAPRRVVMCDGSGSAPTSTEVATSAAVAACCCRLSGSSFILSLRP